MSDVAIVILNENAIKTANAIKSICGGTIYGLEGRVSVSDKTFGDTAQTLRSLYANNTTIIGICASGILIRALAPDLTDKRSEPPLLAVSDDGAVVVPLMGGLSGANELAKELADKLSGTPAITASGARHFGVQLEAPPNGYVLGNNDSESAKRITSDILAGRVPKLIGEAAWLSESDLPFKNNGDIEIRISIYIEQLEENTLLYHPKSVLIEIEDENVSAAEINTLLSKKNIALASLAALVTNSKKSVGRAKEISRELNLPLRLVDNYHELNIKEIIKQSALKIIELTHPVRTELIGRSVGRLTVLGLGPGKSEWQTIEVQNALSNADALFGYKTYLDFVPIKLGQQRFPSDNRAELERARAALDFAAKGNHVAIVSSGDPGIFAMASAVMEAIDHEPTRWSNIDLEILPGLSAMQGAASLIGAPLGHDFCVISLSDIRKPMDIIKQRIRSAIKADFVIAIYNPASKTRRSQIEEVLELLQSEKPGLTPALIAKNVGRDGETLKVINLKEIDPGEIDMRTLLIIGSSKTRRINRPGGLQYMYTPRSYSTD